jgi:hypothetical protein
MRSGASDIRQLVIGQQTIQQSLGVLASGFLEEEEFTHPQRPPMLKRGTAIVSPGPWQVQTFRHG